MITTNMTPKQYECYLPYAKEHEREKIEAIIKAGGIGAITYAKDRGEVDRKWVHPRLN